MNDQRQYAYVDFPDKFWMRYPAEKPEEGKIYDTKIHDDKGIRNECKLKFMCNRWFHPDGTMYVYYNPTHFR